MGRTKRLGAGGVLALMLALTGCGGSTVEGEYEGALQDPEGPEQLGMSLEIEERGDGSLRGVMRMVNEEGERRFEGPEPENGQFEMSADAGLGGEVIIDGEVDGDDLEADVYMGGDSGQLSATRVEEDG